MYYYMASWHGITLSHRTVLMKNIWIFDTTSEHISCRDGDGFAVKNAMGVVYAPCATNQMNAVARAQLTFQMLTLLQTYLYHQSQYSKTWDWKCLALIAQMVRTWIRRLGVRVPLWSRHFLSQKLWHFHKNIHWCVENECWCMRTVNISNVNFT